ncbi:MAG: hypothetical protein QOJ34_848, partial [Pseudonocardiales bacterium]|nr:hypothetical protein [Pseudonocardiales bacterium]
MPYGDSAALVEPDDPAAVLGLAAALRAEPGVAEVVPGACTLLVRAAADVLERLAARLPELAAGPAAEPGGAAEVVLAVRYDGPDLAAAAAGLRISAEELVRRHAAGNYVVAFCGF